MTTAIIRIDSDIIIRSSGPNMMMSRCDMIMIDAVPTIRLGAGRVTGGQMAS
ncbi:hypothetical protein PGT21_013625 [Puccinia graminis f. sp. tritici]|uniref:Uncharacterized protein n=1 Tax=Puccinia graminis f. sp. tritici TaxID=56615 RepID=A0A5B0NJM8_PUCGR|nr:hypothetical protein PGT21_013625 [Puccinia graminis f. sp. tritici]KAA1088029.1 hypothetical protein PGTUg99_021374 [Puccinia graminis f. sp. tritici]